MKPTKQTRKERKRWRRWTHLELLLVLVGLFVAESFLNAVTTAQRTIFNLLFLALVMSAIRTLSHSKRRQRFAIALGIIAFVGSWICEVTSSFGLLAAVYSCYIVVFALFILALSESVFTDGPVNSNRIIGAISIYFVLGLAWAFLYSLLELLQPGSFSISRTDELIGARQGMVGEFIYFSTVTLTSLGYGDIVPISDPARMFASLQAMFGQLYMTIVIARLVGLHISHKRESKA